MFFSLPRLGGLRRTCSVFVVLIAFLPAAVSAANARTTPRREADDAHAYKGIIVIDAATGNVLAEDNGDYRGPPASMAKLMTFAVLHDKLARGELTLSTPVKIEAVDTGMGGTQVWLDPRETFLVEDLIYAMMIQSANDAAHALARAAAGSRAAFVDLMNAKARELGMLNTVFRTPHGLPPASRKMADGDLTTPRDFALLCRHLVLKTDVLRYTSVTERDFAPERSKGPVRMANHNRLLGKVAGVDGLKTGYTRAAGYCLSATAERGGRRVILVVMGSFGPGGRADYGAARDLKAVEYIERGFSALPPGSSNFAAERAKYVKPAVIDIGAAGHAPSMPLPAASPSRPVEDAPRVRFSLPPTR